VSDEAKQELIRRAEQAIVDVVVEWGKKKVWQERELSDLEQELKAALWDLERAKRVTGQVKVPGGE